LLNHPNILKFKEGFEDEGYLYLVLEFMENGSLSDLVKKIGCLDEKILKKLYIK
jgi:serine/threonine protein kinase